jgi:hypothetical protein
MGEIHQQQPGVKLFVGLLAANEELLQMARRRLALDFSPVDHESPVIPFTYSDYYNEEMGDTLLRQWISLTEPIHITELPGIKIFTNRLETLYSREGRRAINIDPGYVTLGKVVLATTKDYDHRLYVRDGIFEEVTLHYRRTKGFLPWPWTYPDYKCETALEFFQQTRRILQSSIEREATAK